MLFYLEYASARVRVMRSKLLHDESLERVDSSNNMSELVSALSGTMYEKLFFDEESDKIQKLRGLLVDSEEKILSFLPREMKPDFYKILLKHEIDNVKMVLRGISSGFAKEEIMKDLYPKGIIFEKLKSSFPENFSHAVLLFKEVPNISDKLFFDYRSEIISDVERQVDREYLRVVKKIDNPLFLDYVKYMVMVVDRSVYNRGQIYRVDVTEDIFMPEDRYINRNNDDILSSDNMLDKAEKYILSDSNGVGVYLNFMIRLERDVNHICASIERLS